jgi:hypothetical protein
MKLGIAEATDKAWQLVKLMEADYGDKLVVSLLKMELLSAAEHVDAAEYYSGKSITDVEICTDPDSTFSHDPDDRAQRNQLQESDSSHTQVEGPQVRVEFTFAGLCPDIKQQRICVQSAGRVIEVPADQRRARIVDRESNDHSHLDQYERCPC